MKKIIAVQILLLLFMVSCSGNHNADKIAVVDTSKNDTLLTNISTKEIIQFELAKPAKTNGRENFYDNYSVIKSGDAEPCSIKLNNKIYKTDNAILDYGELQLLLYENDNDNIAFIGLIDYYGSVFFVYYISNEILYKLGEIDSDQPDAEEKGFKETTFDVYKGLVDIDFRKQKTPEFATTWPDPDSKSWNFRKDDYMGEHDYYRWGVNGTGSGAVVTAKVCVSYAVAQDMFLGKADNTTMMELPWIACGKKIGTACAESSTKSTVFFVYKNVAIEIRRAAALPGHEDFGEILAEWLFDALKAAPLKPLPSE